MKVFDLKVTTSIVVANMIGTGVFTTLGLQMQSVQSTFSIMLLWLAGGLIAFCGAICYARLATIFPRSGGEYHFISKIYNPAFGFVAGMISIVAGFAAPLALTALAMGNYLQNIVDLDPIFSGTCIIVLLSIIHATSVSKGGKAHFGLTILKIALILFFIVSAFLIGGGESGASTPAKSFVVTELFSSNFAVALVFISFAYSGWNASCYIQEEVKNQKKNITRSLLIGTSLVTVLYLLINFAFLHTGPTDQLIGRIDVAHVAALHIFGNNGALMMDALIAFGLIASISSLIIAGPRVMKVMGEDHQSFKSLALINSDGAPARSILLQSFIALVLLLTFSFESILLYVGFTLMLFTMAVVFGLLLTSFRNRSIKLSTLQIVSGIVFLGINTWTVLYLIYSQPYESLAGALVIAAGFIFYYLFVDKKKEVEEVGA
ncbi:amino acid permease [Fulvivirgaceae bacterium BMA10]|uniref:Amino acid permease n=1 Tax=Splendidivirga corallicola TaxID=3051826 RepID=A0ABT8KXK2_9BACT|nr:amino acid permease [Fulvivirgaceae bacterium BMA10]